MKRRLSALAVVFASLAILPALAFAQLGTPVATGGNGAVQIRDEAPQPPAVSWGALVRWASPEAAAMRMRAWSMGRLSSPTNAARVVVRRPLASR